MFSEARLVSYSAGRHCLGFFFPLYLIVIVKKKKEKVLKGWWILIKNCTLGAKDSSQKVNIHKQMNFNSDALFRHL